MGRKALSQDLSTWEGARRNRETAHVNTHPGEWMAQGADWVSQSRGPMYSSQAHLTDLKSIRTDRLEKSGLYSWGVYRCCPQAWKREVPSPSQVNALALPTACHSLALDLRWLQQGKRCTMCYIWAEPQTPTQAEHWASVSTPTLLQQCPPLVQRSQCGEKEKHTIEGNGASLSQTFRYSVPATWEKTPNLTGQWWLLSREQVLPHTPIRL